MYSYPNNDFYYGEDDRFILAPFLLGGLAGGVLGYGIASNNKQQYYPMPMYSYPIYPMYSNSNYYYY